MLPNALAALAWILFAGAVPAAGLPAAAGCGAPPPIEAGASAALELEVAGRAREYRLHLPPSYDPARPSPLLLHFHGYTGSAVHSEDEFTGLSELADGKSFVVVYPQSTVFEGELGGERRRITSWNDLACNASPGPAGPTCAADAEVYPCPPECGDCGPCNWCSCHDDVAFVEALLERLAATLCVDPARIYASGYSNGGMFVQRLACVMPERFAAVAPMHGTLARGFNCAGRTSLLLISGRGDTTVPADGSRSSDGYFYTPAAEVARAWAAANSCAATPVAHPTPWSGVRGLECRRHEGCAGGVEVLDCRWDGAHDWPAGETPFGNELLWSFFD